MTSRCPVLDVCIGREEDGARDWVFDLPFVDDVSAMDARACVLDRSIIDCVLLYIVNSRAGLLSCDWQVAFDLFLLTF